VVPVEGEKEPANYDHEFTISTAGMKRDKAILELGGIKYDSYLKNPVVMFAHNYGKLPIGRTTELKLTPQRWTAKVKYAPTPEALQVKQLVEEGFLRAASVAWIPLKTEPIR